MTEVILTANAAADQIATLAEKARPHSSEVFRIVFVLMSQRLQRPRRFRDIAPPKP